MNTKIRSVLTAASLLALSAITSHAQLLLNGVTSTFSNFGGGVTAGNPAVNTAGTSNVASVSFGSNLVVTTYSTPVSPVTAPPVISPIPVGGLLLPNGVQTSIDAWYINRLTSTQFNGAFDFALALDFAGGAATDLNLNFRMTLAPTGVTGETYAITLLPGTNLLGTFSLGTSTYSYELFPSGLTAASIGTNSNGLAAIDIAFSLVTVPEPSTYALFGAMALMGVVAIRRYRASKVTV